MPTVQLAPRDWRIPLVRSDLPHAFLLGGDDGSLSLLDAGPRRAPKAVLASLGRAPGDVTHLLLSHAHSDLGELDFDVAAFAHGTHVSDGARTAVRAVLAGRPS